MNDAMTLEQLDGKPVIGSDGSKIGTVEDIYFDQDTREPEWALVKTGMFGTKTTFVPITNATATGDELQVPFTKDQVKGAPNLDDDGELSQDEEAMLAQHYGMDYTEAPSDTALEELNERFGHLCTTGRIARTDPLAPERNDRDHLDLPRIAMAFDVFQLAGLHRLIGALNAD